MIKYKILILTCYILFTGCGVKPKFEYDYNKLSKAWQINDTVYLKNWVQNLYGLDFVSFANRVSEFANVTDFYYGSIDLEGHLAVRWNKKEKEVYRNNVTRIYSEYLKSCLFLNKSITYERPMAINDKYWRDSTMLVDNDIKNFRVDIARLCNSNRHNINLVP